MTEEILDIISFDFVEGFYYPYKMEVYLKIKYPDAIFEAGTFSYMEPEEIKKEFDITQFLSFDKWVDSRIDLVWVDDVQLKKELIEICETNLIWIKDETAWIK